MTLVANVLLVWDEDGPPPAGKWTTVLWRAFGGSSAVDTVSMPDLVEEHADRLKARYLGWIYELGETSVDGMRLVDHLELRPGFSYWWMSLIAEKCNWAHSPLITDAIRLIAFDGWATDQSVGSIVLTSSNEPLAECMRLWCAKANLPFEWRRGIRSMVHLTWLRRMRNSSPLVLKAIVGLLRHVSRRWPLRGLGLKKWQQTEGRLTFVSYLFNLAPDAAKVGRYESRYWAHLPDDLVKDGCNTNWLHLYVEGELVPSAFEAACTISNFNKTANGEQIHVTLDTFLTKDVVFKTLRDWTRLVWRGARLQQAVSSTASQGIDLWPLFLNDWRQSIVGSKAMINALHLNLFESAMKALPQQRIGVYLFENQPWEFALIHAWKGANQGRLIGAQHATILYWDLRYFFDPRSYKRTGHNDLPLPDLIAINGPIAMNTYLKSGYPRKNLVKVEALRYLNTVSFKALKRFELSPLKGTIRVLVLCDFFLENTHLQMRLLEQAVKFLPSDLKITVKPHPYCPVKPLNYPGLNMEVTMEPIFKLLPMCDVAYTSAATSAAVDAYCSGVPVVSLRDPNACNLSPLRGHQDVLFVSTPTELASSLVSASNTTNISRESQNFFTIDSRLSRWRKLLLEPT